MTPFFCDNKSAKSSHLVPYLGLSPSRSALRLHAVMAAREVLNELGLRGREDLFLSDVVVSGQGELGRGSYAVVRKAEWQGTEVAVKILHPLLIDPNEVDSASRAAQLRGFGREIDKLRQLIHPHLTQFLGVTSVLDDPALVIELMSASLAQKAFGRQREDDTTLLSYLADAAAGLRFLHSRGVVHRDLAPKNVLIRDGRAKLCDFGVAMFIGGAGSLLEQWRRSVNRTRCPGTLVYMPPEALEDRAKYDASLDVFSFGVLGFAVLTGVEPSGDLILLVPRTERVGSEDRPIPERVRRAEDISRVPDGHQLKDLFVSCISNTITERPSAEILQRRLAAIARVARGLRTVSSVMHWYFSGVLQF